MSLEKFLKGKKSLKGFREEKDPDIVGLDLNIMKQDHTNGVARGVDCNILEMSENFSWMRGHQNCWTGFPNDGKTTFLLFMNVVMSLREGWKWVVWSPEMKSANYVDGKIKVHYNTLAYEMMAMITGKTPYRHVHEKYHVPFMLDTELDLYKAWIEEHFIFLDPEKKDIKSMQILLERVFEAQGFDGIVIDPFKNIEKETNKREDQHLHDVFSEFKDFAVKTNTVMNWIAHPKSGVSRVDHNGNLNPCNQYMLAGGAAWDNSMDGIYSIQRPDTLQDLASPSVTFHTLKQRMSELVGQRGKVENIEFDIKKRRYNFNGRDVLG